MDQNKKNSDQIPLGPEQALGAAKVKIPANIRPRLQELIRTPDDYLASVFKDPAQLQYFKNNYRRITLVNHTIVYVHNDLENVDSEGLQEFYAYLQQGIEEHINKLNTFLPSSYTHADAAKFPPIFLHANSSILGLKLHCAGVVLSHHGCAPNINLVWDSAKKRGLRSTFIHEYIHTLEPKVVPSVINEGITVLMEDATFGVDTDDDLFDYLQTPSHQASTHALSATFPKNLAGEFRINFNELLSGKYRVPGTSPDDCTHIAAEYLLMASFLKWSLRHNATNMDDTVLRLDPPADDPYTLIHLAMWKAYPPRKEMRPAFGGRTMLEQEVNTAPEHLHHLGDWKNLLFLPHTDPYMQQFLQRLEEIAKQNSMEECKGLFQEVHDEIQKRKQDMQSAYNAFLTEQWKLRTKRKL